MRVFRFILIFGGPTLIFKNIIFLIWCIAAASLFMLCLEHSVLATEWDISTLFNLWGELHMHIT